MFRRYLMDSSPQWTHYSPILETHSCFHDSTLFFSCAFSFAALPLLSMGVLLGFVIDFSSCVVLSPGDNPMALITS